MIPKPHKPLEEASSYRPISLLPIMNKILEEAMLERSRPILEENRILPEHQFGFPQKHSTTVQVHRITEIRRGTLEKKQYCSVAFLDITQACNKVWHPGLLFKIRKIIPYAYYRILESINQSKSTLRNQTCPTVQMGSGDLPQKNEVKSLGMHLNRRMTRAKHIKTKRKQFNLKAKQMH
jgi:hypothetical protein